MNGAPVARTASTCFSEISSIASANSLPMKPIDATVSARMPASAPKPTALTNRIATITGWNERHSAMSSARRPGHPRRHQVARGEQADRQREHDAERGGEDRDLEALVEPLGQQLQLVGEGIGRKHARRRTSRRCRARCTKRSQVTSSCTPRRHVDAASASHASARPVAAGTPAAALRRALIAQAAHRASAALIPASPRRRRSASGARRSRPPGGPSNTTRPPAMPMMRSAKRFASATSCMLTSTGMPRPRRASPAAP